MKTKLTYKAAGVNQEKKDHVIDWIISSMKSTHSDACLPSDWQFAGMFSLGKILGSYREPVLVSCTDGVGTKTKLASLFNKHDTIGIDLVAMNVNDLVTCGGTPLFFLDYIAMGKVDKKVLKDIVKGVISGCRLAESALLGGETAEMPDVYKNGDYDLTGFAVGIVDRSKIIVGEKQVRVGDKLIGLASSGLHSNGFSLARKALSPLSRYKELLTPTRIYVKAVKRLVEKFDGEIHGLANITGGGLVENVPRCLPKGCDALIRKDLWRPHNIFKKLMAAGIVESEMFKTFNMGIGMVVIASNKAAEYIVSEANLSGDKAKIIGEVVNGKRLVNIV